MGFTIDPMRAVYDFDHGRVNFYATYGSTPLKVAVSEEALMDHCGAISIEGAELISAFQGSVNLIGSVAENKYRAGIFETDGYVLVTTGDL